MRTPGPWIVSGAGYNMQSVGIVKAIAAWHPPNAPLVAAVYKDCGSEKEAEDNAAFIVLACNAHERLVESLRGMLLSADCSWEENDGGHDWREACRKARAVLAEMGGEVKRRRRHHWSPVIKLETGKKVRDKYGCWYCGVRLTPKNDKEICTGKWRG